MGKVTCQDWASPLVRPDEPGDVGCMLAANDECLRGATCDRLGVPDGWSPIGQPHGLLIPEQMHAAVAASPMGCLWLGPDERRQLFESGAFRELEHDDEGIVAWLKRMKTGPDAGHERPGVQAERQDPPVSAGSNECQAAVAASDHAIGRFRSWAGELERLIKAERAARLGDAHSQALLEVEQLQAEQAKTREVLSEILGVLDASFWAQMGSNYELALKVLDRVKPLVPQPMIPASATEERTLGRPGR